MKSEESSLTEWSGKITSGSSRLLLKLTKGTFQIWVCWLMIRLMCCSPIFWSWMEGRRSMRKLQIWRSCIRFWKINRRIITFPIMISWSWCSLIKLFNKFWEYVGSSGSLVAMPCWLVSAAVASKVFQNWPRSSWSVKNTKSNWLRTTTLKPSEQTFKKSPKLQAVNANPYPSFSPTSKSLTSPSLKISITFWTQAKYLTCSLRSRTLNKSTTWCDLTRQRKRSKTLLSICGICSLIVSGKTSILFFAWVP